MSSPSINRSIATTEVESDDDTMFSASRRNARPSGAGIIRAINSASRSSTIAEGPAQLRPRPTPCR